MLQSASRSAFFSLLVIGLLSAALAAQPTGCARPLRVAYYDAGAFYDPATGTGIDRDIIDEIAKRTGCRIDGGFLSRVLVLHAFEQGKLDLLTSTIPSPERLRYGEHVPFFWTHNELVTRVDHFVHDTPEAFLADKSLRLGVVNHYLHGAGWDEWIDALRAQGRVEAVGDTHALMQLLDAGRIDAFPAVPLGSKAYVNLYGVKPTLRRISWFADRPATTGGLLLSRSTLDASTRAAIAAALRDMRQDGTLAAIFFRYVHDKDAVEMLLTPPQ